VAATAEVSLRTMDNYMSVRDSTYDNNGIATPVFNSPNAEPSALVISETPFDISNVSYSGEFQRVHVGTFSIDRNIFGPTDELVVQLLLRSQGDYNSGWIFQGVGVQEHW
jgi:hypothetical protein